jgi:hypothetical protein
MKLGKIISFCWAFNSLLIVLLSFLSQKVRKTDKLSFKIRLRQPMGVDKVASFENLTNFSENSTRVERFN